jgi:hypothetical protein
VTDVAREVDDQDAVGDRLQRRRELGGADGDRVLDPLLLAAVDQGDDVERVAGRRLDPADPAHDRHRLATGAGDVRVGEDVAAAALFADALPERLVFRRRRGGEHVAADELGRRHAEQASRGAVGGDDAQPLGLDQADRLEHRLDQRRPGATGRLGDAERVDRQRVVHGAPPRAARAAALPPDGAEHSLGRPGAVLIPRRSLPTARRSR